MQFGGARTSNSAELMDSLGDNRGSFYPRDNALRRKFYVGRSGPQPLWAWQSRSDLEMLLTRRSPAGLAGNSTEPQIRR
jgi:hypothetical protein